MIEVERLVLIESCHVTVILRHGCYGRYPWTSLDSPGQFPGTSDPESVIWSCAGSISSTDDD